jgi:hypothetical protein
MAQRQKYFDWEKKVAVGSLQFAGNAVCILQCSLWRATDGQRFFALQKMGRSFRITHPFYNCLFSGFALPPAFSGAGSPRRGEI